MSILVDGAEVFAETQTEKDKPRMHEVDLSAQAGKTVAVMLRVDAIGNNAADWSHWLRPVIVVEPAPR